MQTEKQERSDGLNEKEHSYRITSLLPLPYADRLREQSRGQRRVSESGSSVLENSPVPETSGDPEEGTAPIVSQPADSEVTEDVPVEGSPKSLVVYFSWSGNTRNVAEAIRQQTGSNMFALIRMMQLPGGWKRSERCHDGEDMAMKRFITGLLSALQSFVQSLTAIAKLAPDAGMGEALSIHYSGGASLASDIRSWLEENHIPAK